MITPYLPELDRGQLNFEFEQWTDTIDQDLDEPINWGDLSITRVDWCRSFFKDDGPSTLRIVLEEASPGSCPKFCVMVADWVKRQPWCAPEWDIEVNTEW